MYFFYSILKVLKKNNVRLKVQTYICSWSSIETLIIEDVIDSHYE